MGYTGKIIILICAALLSANNSYAADPVEYAGSSILSSGKWFKLAVTQNGIYRIDFSRLRQLGLTNPSSPRIYGNNAGQLSYYNDDPRPDDLKEISIMLVKGADGIFNDGDYLLFYAQGTHRWSYNYANGDFDFIRHNYCDTAFYFLTSSPTQGKIISIAPDISSPANYSTGAYDALHIHELETENLIKSGREWFQPVSSLNNIPVLPSFGELVPGEEVGYSIRVLGRSSVPTMFRFYEGTQLHESIPVPEVNLLSTTGTYASNVVVSGTAPASSASPSYELKFYNNGDQGAKGWVDYVKLHGRSVISFTGKTTEFRDSRTVMPGRITDFNLRSTYLQLTIWDVTDPFNPAVVQYTKTGDNNRFRALTDSLRTFVAFSTETALTPLFRTKPVKNQNLHASPPADMIIVTHPLFMTYAVKLAEIHNQNSGLVSLIVTPDEIYNEYSGGVQDIVAIRNFLRMKFLKQKNSTRPLRYLLLFGDGSIENKTLPPMNPNFIPTYQSQNSTVVVSSFTSDDFYGLLEDGEGEADGTEDLGIGRFPVSDTIQASIMVSKVKRYIDSEGSGDWKNIISVAADDEDGNTHMNDAEGLYSLLNSTYPEYNVDKIYLDAFRQVTSVNGQSYPDVTDAINDRINSGCLIFDYLGHGNEIGLAHERVVKTENINSWRNGSKLPLFITATCEFSRFDDIDINPVNREMVGKTSAGEMVLINPDGGGIALMTTTRVVYSAPNYTLNRNILKYAFTRDSDGKALALGDIIKIAKQNSGNGMNKRNFLLLGDPAVKLAYPWHGRVVTDSVNGKPVTEPTDTLKALSLVTVSGHIEDYHGTAITDFEGFIYPLVYDKTSRIKTLANDGGQVMEFDLRNNILFSGKTEAENGRFSFSFIVPKDIDYSFGPGKISYYAARDKEDMGGSFAEIIVGGFTNVTVIDTSGPVIRLFLNDTLFRNGGMSDENPVLLALIEDDGGINTTGSGIGHDLTAFLDGDRNNSFVLNSYFETDLDNYKKGRVTYPLNNIAKGDHTIDLKAWDNFNNSATATLKFVVRTDNGFIINNLINYPNPFTAETSITAEHNRPDEELNIRIYIYNMSGKLVRMIETDLVTSGYKIPPIIWDGNNANGSSAGRGLFPYSVVISTKSGETSRVSGRMIIL